ELGADLPLLGFDGGGYCAYGHGRLDAADLKHDIDSLDLATRELDLLGHERLKSGMRRGQSVDALLQSRQFEVALTIGGSHTSFDVRRNLQHRDRRTGDRGARVVSDG